MAGIIERAGTCPIIFDMLERLKEAVGFRRFTIPLTFPATPTACLSTSVNRIDQILVDKPPA